MIKASPEKHSAFHKLNNQLAKKPSEPLTSPQTKHEVLMGSSRTTGTRMRAWRAPELQSKVSTLSHSPLLTSHFERERVHASNATRGGGTSLIE